MNITVNVQLAEGDQPQGTPDELAEKVLQALGGNPDGDICTVMIQQPMNSGVAGKQAMPPPPPPPSETGSDEREA